MHGRDTGSVRSDCLFPGAGAGRTVQQRSGNHPIRRRPHHGMRLLLLPVRVQPYGFRRDARAGETDDADGRHAAVLVRGAGGGPFHAGAGRA